MTDDKKSAHYKLGEAIRRHRAREMQGGPTPDEAFRYGAEIGRLEQRIVQLEASAKRASDERHDLFEEIQQAIADTGRNRKIALFAHEKIHSARAMISTMIYSLGQLIRQDPDGPGPSVVTETLERLDRDGLERMREKQISIFGKDDDEVPV